MKETGGKEGKWKYDIEKEINKSGQRRKKLAGKLIFRKAFRLQLKAKIRKITKDRKREETTNQNKNPYLGLYPL